ncbi:SNF2-like helicase [Hokovirus HKV1]|uniref:SNF2-like helicase n=1 Tax=Hokovirus HKV1 TaxID=1977638 RepID=A0A1V0SHA8_9VIRU|nr:SNF2-like helicase [Hokovirus HKV1]
MSDITKRYKKYTIPKRPKSFDSICFPKEFTLQNPQLFLADFLGPKSNNNSVLVFHQIGSGKTCTAIRIAEAWVNLKQVVIVTPASLIGNMLDELRSECAGNKYISDKERQLLKKLDPKSKEYLNIIEKSNDKIYKNYKIFSYNKFVRALKENTINLKNTVLIIDEVQNIVSETGTYYEEIYQAIKDAPKNIKIVLLSATPMFDKPSEIALTVNLLKLQKEMPTGLNFVKKFLKMKKITNEEGKKITIIKPQNLDKFKEYVKGHISYYRGAPPYVYPENKIKYIKCHMSNFQYKSYLTALQQEQKNMRLLKDFQGEKIEELPQNFLLGSRIISNIAFPNKDINEDGYESLKDVNLSLDNLKKYSIKFYSILSKIRSCSGTIFIYSNFKEYGGIKSLVCVLEAFGYKNYLSNGKGKKRFAIWSGETSQKHRAEIKAVFNNYNNHTGKHIKIVLGTPSTKEGISWANVQQLHILEPYWNYSRMLQIMGRGVRFCSHKMMPEEKRKIKIYIYLAVHESEKMTVDQKIMKLALDKKKLIEPFEMALKSVAVDCELFKHGNVFEGEKDIVCEI